MGLFAKHSETEQLSGQSYVITPPRRRRRWVAGVLAIAVAAALAFLVQRYDGTILVSSSRIEALEKENVELRAALDEARMSGEMEKATRAELEKQLKELSLESSRLKEELDFFKKAERKP